MSSDLSPTATATALTDHEAETGRTSAAAPPPPAQAQADASYTAAEVDAAIAALAEPGALVHAQEVVTHAAPALERLLGAALHEGGWFGSAHEAEVARAAAEPDPDERQRTVATLVAEQTRLGMFVGVAVGFELARELQRQREQVVSRQDADPQDLSTPSSARSTPGPAASTARQTSTASPTSTPPATPTEEH